MKRSIRAAVRAVTATGIAAGLAFGLTACSEAVDQVDKVVDEKYEVTYEVTGRNVDSIQYHGGGGEAMNPKIETVDKPTLPWTKTVQDHAQGQGAHPGDGRGSHLRGRLHRGVPGRRLTPFLHTGFRPLTCGHAEAGPIVSGMVHGGSHIGSNDLEGDP
jgi:hypothetical protein